MNRPMSADEKRWRAEDDARIIANYLEIMKDKQRLEEATKIAEIQAIELQQRANIMKKVSKKGGRKK